MCFRWLWKNKKISCKTSIYLLNILYVILAVFFLLSCPDEEMFNKEGIDGSKLRTIGYVTIIIAVIGCIGTVLESQQLIIKYAFSMFCFIIAENLLASGTFDEYSRRVRYTVTETFANLEVNREKIDNMQREWQCCGIDGPKFWIVKPSSCCNTSVATLCTLLMAHQEGCLTKYELPSTITNLVAYLVLGLAGIKVFGFTFAVFLLQIIRNEGHGRLNI